MKSQRAYVQHVIECIGRIAEDSAAGRDAVLASRTLQDAIVRNLQVRCESTQRIDEAHKGRHPEIDWTSIAGMRNVLAHDYFEVDFETVWNAVAARSSSVGEGDARHSHSLGLTNDDTSVNDDGDQPTIVGMEKRFCPLGTHRNI